MSSPKKIPVSVLIIGQDCERHIERCLNSLKDFEEVIFVDGGSEDKTEELVCQYDNVKFYYNPWPGFIEQRNFSLDCASKEWCFMIDSDEAATPELVEAIRRVCEEGTEKLMYRVMRTEFFEGHAIESGHGKSEYQERLFKKKRIRYTGGVHHKHLLDGKPIESFPGVIEDFPPHVRVLHDPDYGLDDLIKKLPRFSITIGQEKFKKGRRVSPLEIMVTFLWTGIRMMWKSRKNGAPGVVLSLMKAYNDSLAKLYLYNLHRVHKVENLEGLEKKKLG